MFIRVDIAFKSFKRKRWRNHWSRYPRESESVSERVYAARGRVGSKALGSSFLTPRRHAIAFRSIFLPNF